MKNKLNKIAEEKVFVAWMFESLLSIQQIDMELWFFVDKKNISSYF